MNDGMEPLAMERGGPVITWKVYATVFLLATVLWAASPANGWYPNLWMQWAQRIALAGWLSVLIIGGLDWIWFYA